jgi:hypothetical protein
VNSKAYFIIEVKCASILHLRVSISNIFATDGFIKRFLYMQIQGDFNEQR